MLCRFWWGPTEEMAAAAMFAEGQFWDVPIAQLLYGGDDVIGFEEWDHRGWISHGVREDLPWLAVESCLGVGPGPQRTSKATHA